MGKIVKKEKLYQRAVSVSPSRSYPAYRAYRIRAQSPFIFPSVSRGLNNAADFVSVAWRSQSVSARLRLRARAAGIGPSIRFPRYGETPRRRLLSSCLIALIYRAPSHYLFAFLSHAVCRRVVSRFPIYASRCSRIFFPSLFPHITKKE